MTIGLRWLAVLLLLATGIVHTLYGAYYVGGTTQASGGYGGYAGDGGSSYGGQSATPGGISTVFYVMGAIYFIGVVLLALNHRPRLFQLLALIYTLLLLIIWGVAGARDTIAFLDKAIEVILIINLVVLLRQKPETTVAQ
ncbi:MAG: hypothetical protein HYU03_07315 [Thaumarchaeota archaeon]|nr:hypothetical protein [Nitrososphaerota archaeon]